MGGSNRGVTRLMRQGITVICGLAAAGLLSGCGSGGGTTAGGVMGGGSAGGMMGGAPSGYHFSRLTCSAPASLPEATVRVVLGDLGMTQRMGGTAPMGAHMMLRAVPATVPTGQVGFVAQNVGWRTHELVILPLPDGAAAGQRVPDADGTVDETGSLGEASNSCAAGTGEGITSGAVGWTTLTLPAGRYELVCNLPNHYADGMYQELDAT